jgi:hypothetical protein
LNFQHPENQLTFLGLPDCVLDIESFQAVLETLLVWRMSKDDEKQDDEKIFCDFDSFRQSDTILLLTGTFFSATSQQGSKSRSVQHQSGRRKNSTALQGSS